MINIVINIIPSTPGVFEVRYIRLVPMSVIEEVMDASAPRPTDIKVITEPTPMITPSIVSEDRSLLAFSDLIAIMKDSNIFTV